MTVAKVLEDKLRKEFNPGHLEVVNESHMHNVPPGAETHFKVTLVSDAFAGLRPVKRHQEVYRVVAEEMAGPIHALALHTYTPEEWRGRAPESPPCLGGSKHDKGF